MKDLRSLKDERFSLGKIKEFKKFKISKFQNSQFIVFVIALMLVTAGYYNYLGRQEENNTVQTISYENEQEKIGEVEFIDSPIEQDNLNTNVSSSNDEINTNIQTNSNTENANANENINNESNNTINKEEEKVLSENNLDSNTLNTSSNVDYFASCKLEREKMYSQMLDVYQKILESSTISEEQKSVASNEIVKINNNKNGIMVAEDLIKNKDIKDCVIFINGDSVNIIVLTDELTTAKTAQISDILTRELKVNIENVHIVKK